MDVRGEGLRPGQTVLVEGNRIRAVGPVAEVPLPDGTRVIEADGKYLIPGLIDTHVHLFMPWMRNWPDTVAQLGWILAGGVTTVRDAGGLDRSYVALRAAADSGRILAPRIRISGGSRRVMAELGAPSLSAAVSSFGDLGLDAVKLRSVGREQALEIIAAARRVGLPVYGHTRVAVSDSTTESYTLAAVRAGISGLSHLALRYEEDAVRTDERPRITYRSSPGERLEADFHELSGWLDADDEWLETLIDTMVAYGAWLEPTIAMTFHDHEALHGRCTEPYDAAEVQRYYTFHRDPPVGAFPPDMEAAVRRICAAMESFVRSFHDAGGMIVTGSDYPPFPPLGVTEEMRVLVEAGLPPMAALQAATINAAGALDMEDRIGTVEPGKLADLVLLDANPLDDITNVLRVSAVVANGRLLDRDALLERTGTSPPMLAYDDLLVKMDERVREVAFAWPDSVIDVVIRTDGTMRPEDLAGIESHLRFTITAVNGETISARGPAFGTRILSRVRFVSRIELDDTSQ